MLLNDPEPNRTRYKEILVVELLTFGFDEKSAWKIAIAMLNALEEAGLVYDNPARLKGP